MNFCMRQYIDEVSDATPKTSLFNYEKDRGRHFVNGLLNH
jgi:hypothetical protein